MKECKRNNAKIRKLHGIWSTNEKGNPWKPMIAVVFIIIATCGTSAKLPFANLPNISEHLLPVLIIITRYSISTSKISFLKLNITNCDS